MGGVNTDFAYNKFISHQGIYGDQVKANASDIYGYFPENYFEYSQAPIIKIVYASGQKVLTTEGAYTLYFRGNLFKDNKNYQVMTFPEA